MEATLPTSDAREGADHGQVDSRTVQGTGPVTASLIPPELSSAPAQPQRALAGVLDPVPGFFVPRSAGGIEHSPHGAPGRCLRCTHSPRPGPHTVCAHQMAAAVIIQSGGLRATLARAPTWMVPKAGP